MSHYLTLYETSDIPLKVLDVLDRLDDDPTTEYMAEVINDYIFNLREYIDELELELMAYPL